MTLWFMGKDRYRGGLGQRWAWFRPSYLLRTSTEKLVGALSVLSQALG